MPRFSFGLVEFFDGIDFLVVIVGLFAVSEVFIFIEQRGAGTQVDGTPAIGRILPPWSMLRDTLPSMSRGTILGFLAGVLPGAGASLGSFIAYSMEKRLVDRKGTFGTGDPRGVAAPEAGNNAAAGGALVPMLSLGVPGSGTTAVLLAMLLSLNIAPGPLLFEKNPDVVWGLIAALFIANFALLALNLPLVSIFVRLLAIPQRYLMPAVAMIFFVGVYGISGSSFELLLMIGFGFLGWVLRKLDVPLVPVVLGVLLGDQMEKNLRRALTISDGDLMALVNSPLAIGLWIVAFVGFIALILVGSALRQARRRSLNRQALDRD